MSTPPPPEFEFPGDSRVEDWESTLRDRYCSSDPEKSPRDRLRMETLKVTNIRRYKEKKHVEHEYLVAEVEDPVFGQPRYLLIERTVDDTLPANDTTARSPRSSRSALSLSSQSSLGVFSKIPARDHVTKMASWPTGDILIDNIKCQGSKMILLHLAIAAKVVHDHNEKYHLFKRQCFWYTDVISGVLEKEFSLSKAKVSDTSLTADHAPDAEMERFDSLSGTYKKVKFYQRRMEVIDEIHAVFEAYRKNIETSILKAGEAVEAEHKKKVKAQKDNEEAQKTIERVLKEKEEERKEKERALKEREEERKEKERALKEREEERKEKERVQNEFADFKRRMELEGRVTGGTTSL